MKLDPAIAHARAHLLSLRHAAGHWEGELSSSALSTATAVVALHTVDAKAHAIAIARGVLWLTANQNADGGWGDTTISQSNLSTTLLCWSAVRRFEAAESARQRQAAPVTGRVPVERLTALARCEAWLREHVGSLDPGDIAKAVIARYGKDRTFSVPILMHCAICGTLGEDAWHRVLPLPFEMAALPRSWFGAIGLPVVSYALPALIAIGYTRFFHAPPRWWHPLGWLRAALWPIVSPMLRTLQPGSGGYLEATPLTSFVTMALASADEAHHPCVPGAVSFLRRSQRADGSWPIDTNLATWTTTLAVKALSAQRSEAVAEGNCTGLDHAMAARLRAWLLGQQYRSVHPFTRAAPGGWAWTDLPGGVPDADDTSGALIALWHLCDTEEEKARVLPAMEAAITWLLDLQNRDGGVPTFCRGWGALPFDRSTPEITAHAMWAWSVWHDRVRRALQLRMKAAVAAAWRYLERHQRTDGSWQPLWFGNEHAADEENRVHGTAMVLLGLAHTAAHGAAQQDIIGRAVEFLLACQQGDGGWGGDLALPPSIEETANAVKALGAWTLSGGRPPALAARAAGAVARGASWLVEHTHNGTVFPPAPIGLYFARLWYHEKLYPVVWALGAWYTARDVARQAGYSPTPVTS